jgi:hypothetical protein
VSRLIDILLLEVFARDQYYKHGHSAEELQDSKRFTATPNEIQLAIGFLAANDLIADSSVGATPHFKTTPKGRDFLRDNMLALQASIHEPNGETSSLVAEALKSGQTKPVHYINNVQETLAIDGASAQTVPASDRDVSTNDNYVQLDQDPDQYEDFVSSLEHLIGALKDPAQSTNEISIEDAAYMRGQVESAIRVVKAKPALSTDVLAEVVVSPLTHIRNSVSSGLIYDLAKQALDWILKIMGGGG